MSESPNRRPVGSFDTSVASVPHSRPFTPVEKLRTLETPERSRSSPLGWASAERSAGGSLETPDTDKKPSKTGLKDHKSPSSDSRRKHLSKTGGFLLGSKRRQLQDSTDAGRFSPEPHANGRVVSHETLEAPHWRDGSRDGSRHASLDYNRPLSDSLPSTKGKDRVSSQASRTTSSAAAQSEGWPSDMYDGRPDREESPRPSIDAQQLVRMALSLNESRRLHLGPGQLVNPVVTGGQRVPSSGGPPGTSGGHRSSSGLHQPPDFNLTQSGEPHNRHSRQRDRIPSRTFTLKGEDDSNVPFPFLSEYEYKISPASRLRAEKARAYIELGHYYLRLLDILPPLRPGISASHRHESPQGRPYNPIQSIRNRKARNRERKVIDADAAGWNDPERVHKWLDKVEEESQRPNFLQGDIALLPHWDLPEEVATQAGEIADASQSTLPNASKRKRQAIEWIVSRAELFADAYWMEQDDHKALLESHEGRKIYSRLVRPLTHHQEADDQNSEGSLSESFEYIKSSPRSPKFRPNGDPPKDRRDSDDVRPLSSPRGPGIISSIKPRRNLLSRHRGNSIESSDDSQSDKEGQQNDPTRSKMKGISPNIAPLERFMNKHMQKEAQETRKRPSIPRLQSHDSTTGRRMGISEQPHRRASRSNSLSRMHTIERALSASDKDEDDNRAESLSWATLSNDDLTKDGARSRAGMKGSKDAPTLKSKHKHLGKLSFGRRRRGDSEPPEGLLSTDDEIGDGEQRDTDGSHSHQSQDKLHPKKVARHDKKHEGKAEPRNHYHGAGPAKTKAPEERPDEITAQKRLFKTSRIGETAKKIMPLPSDKLLKETKSWVESATSSRSRLASDTSRDDGSTDEARPRKGRFSVEQLRPPPSATRSRSATDAGRRGRDSQYHIQNLPSFTSQSGGKRRGDSPIKRAISPVKRGSIFEKTGASPSPKQSRISQLQGALRSGTRSENVSPSASVLSFKNETSDSDAARAKRRPLTKKKTDPPKQNDPRGRHLYPANVDDDREVSPGMKSTSPNPHHWSIAAGRRVSTSGNKSSQQFSVTAGDIAYTRALLLSCGTKASAILGKASSKREIPSPFLTRAYELSNQNVAPVARKEEHVVAARLLSSHLEKTVSSFESAARHFKSKTASGLAERVADLRDLVGSRLTNRVREGCDNTDSFMAELTQNRTLAVKKVNDSVDEMMRSRRQRLRWLSRAGFAGLEYMLVAILWGIWGIVFVLRICRVLVLWWWYLLQWLLFLR